jgi:ectoine hydroxylase-related dioxygenase (phytanoyl-CoA dioxygenase family)
MIEADVVRHGYGVMTDCLSRKDVRSVRGLLVDEAHSDREREVATMDSGGANQRVWQLVNRHDDFVALATAEPVIELVSRVLGQHRPFRPENDDLPAFLLSNLTANIAGPGGDAMTLHTDQHHVPLPWPEYPLVVNVIWALDDFTEPNGATRVVPGSHAERCRPSPAAESSAVPIEVPAGSAIVLNGMVWHGTGANRTRHESRHAILANYCKPWLRQQENFCVSTHTTVVESASPSLRRLLGFDSYSNHGLIHRS